VLLTVTRSNKFDVKGEIPVTKAMNDLVNEPLDCIKVNMTLRISRSTVKDQGVHRMHVESLEWNLPLGQICYKHHKNIFFSRENFQSKCRKES